MKKNLIAMTDALPDVIRNTHFNITLEGWPAAVTVSVVAICCTVVAVCALKDTRSEEVVAEGVPS